MDNEKMDGLSMDIEEKNWIICIKYFRNALLTGNLT